MHQNKTGYSLAALDDNNACWWFWSQFPLYTLAFDWSNIDTKFDLLARFQFSNILPLFFTVQTQHRKQNRMKLFNEPNAGNTDNKKDGTKNRKTD